MKPTLIAALVLASFSFACGGQSADDADEADVTAAAAYDPFTATTDVKKAVAQYATNASALTLTGTLSADQKSFTWLWTYAGDNGIQVDVQVSAIGAPKVIAHERRYTFAGQAVFNPNNVNVQPSDLQHILTAHHDGIAGTMQLGAGLTANPDPRWVATCPKKAIWVDAVTGALM